MIFIAGRMTECSTYTTAFTSLLGKLGIIVRKKRIFFPLFFTEYLSGEKADRKY